MMSTPHKCPICHGRGTVPPGFYDQIDTGTSISTQRPTCKACGGSGLVWDYHSAPLPQPVEPDSPAGSWSPYKITFGPSCGGTYIPKQLEGYAYNL
jgi:hypothetical protein